MRYSGAGLVIFLIGSWKFMGFNPIILKHFFVDAGLKKQGNNEAAAFSSMGYPTKYVSHMLFILWIFSALVTFIPALLPVAPMMEL